MTTRQAEILDFIKDYISSHGHAPTYQEIADGKNLRSLSTVWKHVQCLRAQGKITFTPTFKQAIQIVSDPADPGRFEFEGPHHLWDKELNCYWVKEVKE